MDQCACQSHFKNWNPVWQCSTLLFEWFNFENIPHASLGWKHRLSVSISRKGSTRWNAMTWHSVALKDAGNDGIGLCFPCFPFLLFSLCPMFFLISIISHCSPHVFLMFPIIVFSIISQCPVSILYNSPSVLLMFPIISSCLASEFSSSMTNWTLHWLQIWFKWPESNNSNESNQMTRFKWSKLADPNWGTNLVVGGIEQHWKIILLSNLKT